MPVQILSTKLSIPPLRSRLVARPRLIQTLNQGLEYGLVLVSAPAGYGKSTLLTAWLNQVKIPAAWLTLDESDNDPPRFLAYLAAALYGIDPAIEEILANPSNLRTQPEIGPLLTPLINALARLERPFYLVFDDYHLIKDQVVQQMVSFLLDHRPALMHLVISTRADPSLPLTRLRARSELLELRQADLCFTTQEAADFLNHTMGLQVLPEDTARVTARTEGWVAGLQMAALSMQNTDDIPGFITTLTGKHHYFFDYLLEEILERQSPEIRRFLLYTSIVDQLNEDLCAALLKEDPPASLAHSPSAILNELDQANLFILPLDHERCWYRYHHLFSDLLRLMLEKTHPGLAVELHRRACRWYEAQEMLPKALQHAISSGDMQLVAQIISANVMLLLENDEMAPILQKIDALPADKITALPWLEIARAWIVGAGQVEKSLQLLAAAEQEAKNVPEVKERQRLNGHIAAARANLIAIQGDYDNAIAQARLANELLPADELAGRVMNLIVWGENLINGEGNYSAGISILEEALALALQAEKPQLVMLVSGSLATGHLSAGKMHNLQRVCREALSIAEDYQRRYQRPLLASAEVYALLARGLAEWGEDEQAVQLARKGVELSERTGLETTQALCLSYLGRILASGNDWEQARRVFQRIENIGRNISPWYWYNSAIFALDAILDWETPAPDEVDRYVRRVQETGSAVPAMSKARLLLRDGQPSQALLVLEQALSAHNEQPSFRTVRLFALRALAFQAQGDEKQALASLQQAVELGEPENRVASFTREGAAMEKLLRLAHAKGISPQFVQRLLAAFSSRRKPEAAPARATGGLIEPLSERELQVLQLLAQGGTDKQIAAALFLTNQTIHSHLKNIYGKLDVHSRTEAIHRARQLELL